MNMQHEDYNIFDIFSFYFPAGSHLRSTTIRKFRKIGATRGEALPVFNISFIFASAHINLKSVMNRAFQKCSICLLQICRGFLNFYAIRTDLNLSAIVYRGHVFASAHKLENRYENVAFAYRKNCWGFPNR